eukprot:scaffold30888_cov93-Skeletonema_dohrnii-CCMP3373.AAC.1
MIIIICLCHRHLSRFNKEKSNAYQCTGTNKLITVAQVNHIVLLFLAAGLLWFGASLWRFERGRGAALSITKTMWGTKGTGCSQGDAFCLDFG